MRSVVAILALVGLLAVVPAANATPVYTGNTYADFGNGETGVPGQATSMTAGYYIWSNDAQGTSWSIRWTGAGSNYTWQGSIEFGGYTLDDYASVSFEGAGMPGGEDVLVKVQGLFETQLEWSAVAGSQWDGIDFTISGDQINVIGFNLGASFISFEEGTDYAVAGQNIFIGQEFVTPEVLLQNSSDPCVLDTQNFEINAPVPEPATLLLIGSGLVGLATGRFKRNRKK